MNLLMTAAIVFYACSPGKQTENDLSGNIRIDGSSTIYPITEAVAEEFRASYPHVNVTVGVSGTGGGFQKFGRAETDLSNASRPIKQQEAESAKRNDVSYIELEVAYDGLAVVANPNNDWLESVTIEELKKIWEPAAQGKIMRWNQIRPEWPDQEIHLFGPGVASGTYDYFTEAVVGKSGSSRGDYTASEDDNVLVQGIAGDKYGLGFFGLAYYEENKDQLKLVSVDGGNGSVYPNMETVSDGSYTPLSRPLFIYVNSVAAKRPEVVEFVKFYLDSAPELAKEVGYVPLPDEEYQKQKENFNSFIKGLGGETL